VPKSLGGGLGGGRVFWVWFNLPFGWGGVGLRFIMGTGTEEYYEKRWKHSQPSSQKKGGAGSRERKNKEGWVAYDRGYDDAEKESMGGNTWGAGKSNQEEILTGKKGRGHETSKGLLVEETKSRTEKKRYFNRGKKGGKGENRPTKEVRGGAMSGGWF